MEMSNIIDIKKSVKDAKIVAATKYVGPNEMINLLNQGINNFGENRVDSFLEKYEALKEYKEIKWHFIGNLQTNKVRKIIGKIDYLHSLNSVKLAQTINKYLETPLNCFLEVNLTDSPTKTGISLESVSEVLLLINELENVNVIGLMTMTEPLMTDIEKEQVFSKLKELMFELNKAGYTNITELSMGMSDDYLIAVSCGATWVRLGRILFK